MLEIFILIKVTKTLVDKCKAKGRSAGLAALFPVAWILGEIAGFCFGGAFFGEGIGSYVVALIMAVGFGGVAYLVVDRMGPTPGFDPLETEDGGSRGTPCPSCGSVMTEKRGGVITCNNCGFEGELDPYGGV